MPGFSLGILPHGDTLTLTLVGELDIATVATLEVALHKIGPDYHAVILDCTGLDFIDSSGLAAILRAHLRLAGDGRELALTAVPDRMMTLIRLVGFDEALRVV